ncbi:MAG TPA: S1 RNA-binding domain-containing protein, partial [Vicinamibacteria bacterium]|nr:S1 RNA-binding domain-containing protein [Vicinamibacteria bacterium]
LSERERKATDAERELIEWKKVRFMADKLGETFGGYVTGVQAFGLFVELDEVYVQGLVHVSSMTDDYYQFNEKAHTLQGENTGKAYRLGDRVKVQVAAVKVEERKIDFALVDVLERAGAGRGPGRPPARPPRSARAAPSRPSSRRTGPAAPRKSGKADGRGRRRR